MFFTLPELNADFRYKYTYAIHSSLANRRLNWLSTDYSIKA